jgi:hypothetical protein
MPRRTNTMIDRVKIYRFRLYDIASDDFKISTHMTRFSFIKQVIDKIIRNTELEIDKKYVNAEGQAFSFGKISLQTKQRLVLYY